MRSYNFNPLECEVRLLTLRPCLKLPLKGRAQALITIRNPLLGGYLAQIAASCDQGPTAIHVRRSQYVEAGCLMSYAVN